MSNKVTFNQAGYRGSSMSVRAMEAYEDGEMPRSKWTKAAMLAALQDWCEENGRVLDDDVAKMRKDAIWSRFFEWKSWHHTGKFAAETDFYGLNADAAEEASHPMTEAEAEAEEAERKAMLMEREAEEAALEARKRAEEAERAEERVRFERESDCPYDSIAGFVARETAREGEAPVFHVSKSGSLMLTTRKATFNLTARTELANFIERGLDVHGASLCAIYDRIADEADAIKRGFAAEVA